MDADAIAWEYLIVSLAPFQTARAVQGESVAVTMLNREGEKGWEAVGMTPLEGGSFAVLLKRRLSAHDQAKPS